LAPKHLSFGEKPRSLLPGESLGEETISPITTIKKLTLGETLLRPQKISTLFSKIPGGDPPFKPL